MRLKLPLYLALLTLTQCSSCKDGPGPNEQLPAATQEGKNTFGCRVNGQVYTPKGDNGTSNSSVLYEPSPVGANLSIRTYSFDKRKQYLSISAGHVTIAGQSFSLDFPVTEGTVYYNDNSKPPPCDDYYDVSYRRGNLTLTRLDEQAGIIAGTFEVTIAKPGCDTIRITDGRFDYKL